MRGSVHASADGLWFNLRVAPGALTVDSPPDSDALLVQGGQIAWVGRLADAVLPLEQIPHFLYGLCCP